MTTADTGRLQYDLFISHASEDKADIARPLANSLKRMGFRVWFDEFELTVGDSLRRSIDRGLASSRFGVVILSRAFFEKEWTQKELDALVARDDGREKVILPVWHGVTRADVVRWSPLLADRLAVSSATGADETARHLAVAMSRDSELHERKDIHVAGESPTVRIVFDRGATSFLEPRGYFGSAVVIAAMTALPFGVGWAWLMSAMFERPFGGVILVVGLIAGAFFGISMGVILGAFMRVRRVGLACSAVGTTFRQLHALVAELGYDIRLQTTDFTTYKPSFQAGLLSGSMSIRRDGEIITIIGPRFYVARVLKRLSMNTANQILAVEDGRSHDSGESAR